MGNILNEIVPLSPDNCFSIFKREKQIFDFPLHYHQEFELNFVSNAGGAKRIVGDSIEVIEDADLVLIGPNLVHSWFDHKCTSGRISEITVQWQKDLYSDKLMHTNQLYFLRKMLENSAQGIVFSRELALEIYPRLLLLNESTGFDSLILLTKILNDLATSSGMRLLTENGKSPATKFNSRRLTKAFDFMALNYSKPIALREVATLVNMSEASFSRFIKQRTGYTFVNSLNDIRLAHACRMLIESDISVADVSFECGFNNYSHFNRLFKKKKHATPKEFRESFRNGIT